MRLLLALAILIAILAVACRASDPPSPPVRNPLEERTATPGIPGPPSPKAGGISISPATTGGPGSMVHPEGAAGHAIEFLAQALGVPVGELGVVSVTPQTWPDTCRGQVHPRPPPGRLCEPVETSGWRVTLRDAFDGLHAADVSAGGTSWLPGMEETGAVLSRDEATRLVVVDVRGTPLTLRIWNSATSLVGVPPAGAEVVFGYDPSPRGDGIPVLLWIERVP